MARPQPMHQTSRVSRFLRHVAPYGAAATGIALASLTAPILTSSGSSQLALTPFALAVALSVWFGGLGPGLFGLALAGLAVDFLVVEPRVLFPFQSVAVNLVLGAFIAAWLLFCVLAGGVRKRSLLDRAARAEAQRAAVRADRVAQLTAALAHARTPAAAIEAALKEPLHALNADAGVMFLVTSDGSRGEVARAFGYEDGNAPASLSLQQKGPAADAVGRGVPVFGEIPAREGAKPGHGSLAVIPFLIGSRVVAVAQFRFDTPQIFSEDDRDYLETLATARGAGARSDVAVPNTRCALAPKRRRSGPAPTRRSPSARRWNWPCAPAKRVAGHSRHGRAACTG